MGTVALSVVACVSFGETHIMLTRTMGKTEISSLMAKNAII
jgi:hypothetical protein